MNKHQNKKQNINDDSNNTNNKNDRSIFSSFLSFFKNDSKTSSQQCQQQSQITKKDSKNNDNSSSQQKVENQKKNEKNNKKSEFGRIEPPSQILENYNIVRPYDESMTAVNRAINYHSKHNLRFVERQKQPLIRLRTPSLNETSLSNISNNITDNETLR